MFLGYYIYKIKNKQYLLLKVDLATAISKKITNKNVISFIYNLQKDIDNIVFVAFDGFTGTKYSGDNNIINYLKNDHLDYNTIPWSPIPHSH